MPTCQGKSSDGSQCTLAVEEGQAYCRWHDPGDASWRATYERLEKATSEERTAMARKLIEDHPEHKLILPRRNKYRANLSYIDFHGERLGLADLEGASLWNANLESAFLYRPNLQKVNLQGANLQKAVFWEADFKKADLMEADLQGADLSRADLRNTSLARANLQSANFREANLQRAHLQEAKLQGVDLSNAWDLSNIYVDGAWLDRTRMRKEQLGGAIGEELDRSYSGAKRGYLALKQNFDDLGDYDASSWAYRKERRMEKLEAKQKGLETLAGRETDEHGNDLPASQRNRARAVKSFSKYASDTLVEWICDYGESVWRVIGWMGALLFIGGPILFWALGGFVQQQELLDRYIALPSPWLRFWYSYRLLLLYTLDTITTANFSGLQPGNDAVKFASGFFAIAGIFLAGLLGFVAGNRIRRS